MVQVLPEDDLFTENATHYGTYLSGYIRSAPWSSFTASSYTVPGALGTLHSGYFGASSSVLPGFGVGSRIGSFYSATAGVPFCAAIHRALYLTTAEASVAFTLYPIAGVPTADSFRWAGVCVRNQGGTYTDTAASEQLSNTTAYWFLLVNTQVLGATFLLLRVAAGVVTVLDTKASGTVNPAWTMPNAVMGVRVLSLHVEDVAGDPVLTAKTSKIGPPQVGGGSNPETTVFTYTDTSGSKITTAGRCGFGACRDRSESSGAIQTTTGIQWFQVTDGTTLQLRDEWGRGTALNIGESIGPDGNGKTGRSLVCGWLGDAHGTETRKLKRDSGNNRLLFDDGLVLYAVSARPATSPVASHRSAVFQVNSGSSASAGGGILARGTWTNATSLHFASGYGVFLLYNSPTAGVWQAIVYRFGPLGTPTQIASKSGMVLSTGTDIQVSFQVVNVGPLAPNSGTPRLSVYINGAQLGTWTIADTSVTEQDAGDLYDGATAAIQSGTLEGMIFDGAASSSVTADTWTELDLEDPQEPPDTPTNDQVSIPVAAEDDDATGTLTIPYDWGIEESWYIRSDAHRYDSGHVNRIARSVEPRRAWVVHADSATESVRDDLLTFYDAHRGPAIPFSWETPGEETVTVRFAGSELPTALANPSVHRFKFGLVEVLDP